MNDDRTLDELVLVWLRARQQVRSERIGGGRWEAAVARAEEAGSACLARIIDLEGQIVAPGNLTPDDRPISVVISEAVVHESPYRSLGK